MKLKIKLLSILTVSAFISPSKVSAMKFDTSLLAGASSESDLSRFYLNNDMPAGTQTVDVYVNQSWKGRFSLLFGEHQGDIRIAGRDAALLGIDLDSLLAVADNDLIPIDKLVQGGRFDFDVATLSLKLTVPQGRVRQGGVNSVTAFRSGNGPVMR
jgi:P pilus assembly protein, porin PapC